MSGGLPRLLGLDPAVLDRAVELVVGSRDAIELAPTTTGRARAWAPRCVVETEQAIQDRAVAYHAARRVDPVSVDLLDRAIMSTEGRLSRPLADSQLSAVVGIRRSRRCLDVVVGMAGTGKMTVLEMLGLAHEGEGMRVIGTATSGQAAKTVGRDADRTTVFPRSLTASNRFSHAHAKTVHRSQGATVDTAHYLEDGGGRELAYVALLRARQGTLVYVEVDDLAQATEDLSINWTNELRQELVIDQHQTLSPPRRGSDGIGIDL